MSYDVGPNPILDLLFEAPKRSVRELIPYQVHTHYDYEGTPREAFVDACMRGIKRVGELHPELAGAAYDVESETQAILVGNALFSLFTCLPTHIGVMLDGRYSTHSASNRNQGSV